jgi:CheY-like chemotaxis protein
MTTPVLVLPLPNPDGSPTKKKRVLLLDTSQTKRDLRADVMRKLGIEVDCAADIIEARGWWRADLYNLVLISVAGETLSRDQFCTDLRGATPPQRIAFFVGGPEYLAAAPHSDALAELDADALHKEMVATLLAQTSSPLSQRWGILEACRKISSVRSVSEARSRALRETPRPSRWAEAIEQHSAPETVNLPTFAAEPAQTFVTTEAPAAEAEREEIL